MEMEQLVAVSVPVAIIDANTVAVPGTWTERLVGSTDATRVVERAATYTALVPPTLGSRTWPMTASLPREGEFAPMASFGRSATVRPPPRESPWAMILTIAPPEAGT